jgi:hypothetical protein
MITEKKYYTENQEKMARYAKAMAHPVRIFILDFLADNINVAIVATWLKSYQLPDLHCPNI